MRKDLHMSPGKLSAQVAHCAEAYWTNIIREFGKCIDVENDPARKFVHDSMNNNREKYGEKPLPYIPKHYHIDFCLEADMFEEYISGRFVKTICEARNKTHLLKAVDKAKELGLVENEDYGLIYDACFTELEPEEENGTTLTGIWFKPLDDEVAHSISKKYQLYK